MMPEHKYDDVLIRFLLKESTEKEEAFVLNWIEEDLDNKLYLESLVKTLNLISLRADSYKIDVDNEWLLFQDRLINGKPVPEFGDRSVLTEDVFEKRKNRKAVIYKLIISTAVAASLIFVAMQWGLFKKNATENIVKLTPAPDVNKIDSLLAVKVHEINISGKIKNLVLPDGSLVALSNNSELTYQEPSIRNKREIFINGKADFNVAKDKTKPFIVYSDAISTTALGTKFTVTALKNDKQIRIRLDEGKIVVKPVKTVFENRMKNFFLLPGQELVYDKITETAFVHFLKNRKDIAQGTNREKLPKENPTIPQFNKQSWFMFNNQPLSEVFDALEDMYDAKINYSKKEVGHMNFIGTFDKSDSLESILKKIAIVNDLKLSKDSSGFKIRKIKF